jgi:hypothetical protein
MQYAYNAVNPFLDPGLRRCCQGHPEVEPHCIILIVVGGIYKKIGFFHRPNF